MYLFIKKLKYITLLDPNETTHQWIYNNNKIQKPKSCVDLDVNVTNILLNFFLKKKTF